MIGRNHYHDENGDTHYRCAEVHQFERLIPIEKAWSENVSEKNHRYVCPTNKVMTGRRHKGDESEPTGYECARLNDAWGNSLQVVPGDWQKVDDEFYGDFECPANTVMTGRSHVGDEREPTYYQCATLW